jgi:1-acyl-sn-glycerol-3-phosphate acyltransferase
MDFVTLYSYVGNAIYAAKIMNTTKRAAASSSVNINANHSSHLDWLFLSLT